jgi:hypothetical protein
MKANILFLSLAVFYCTSCEKYRDFDHLETIENSFSGTISVTETAGDIDGNYRGMVDSGTYIFIWDNPSRGAVLNVDSWSSSGSIQYLLNDARGNQVLNETMFSGTSNRFAVEGKKGKWKVIILFSEFDGDGTFDLNPTN